MNQQNANPVSNLKRRLTFLRTIDQKLEGIRRENERLQRIAANPRVVFSRSSLAGLYRIVNSLVSAGPMYGLPDIEEWAVTSRDWLVALGRRGSGPTEAELERLTAATGELGRLRDEAMAAVEQQLKEVEAQGDREDNEPLTAAGQEAAMAEAAAQQGPATPPEKKSEPTLEESEEFPFTDEPKARELGVSAFAPKTAPEQKRTPPKKKGGSGKQAAERGFRDRTSTIPLAIDDLAMLGTTSKIPQGPPKSGDPGTFWKAFAVLSFIGFAVMTALYVREINRTPRAPETAIAVHTPAPAPVQKPATADTAAPSTDTAASDTETATVSKAEKPPAQMKTDAKNDDPAAKVQKIKAKDKDKDDDKPNTKTHTAPTKPKPVKAEPDPPKEQGILVVKAPVDGSAVFVLVDGVSKGKTPIKTNLSPGLHEVVFTADGKRSMRMVPIKTDGTKTITAVKPN